MKIREGVVDFEVVTEFFNVKWTVGRRRGEYDQDAPSSKQISNDWLRPKFPYT